MVQDIQRVGIIGGGAWGTTLAVVVRRTGRDAVVWAREADVVAAINTHALNPDFLPGVTLDPGIRATSEMAEAVDADVVLLATPAQKLREVASALSASLAPGVPAVICTKGIERDTCALMSEIVAEVLPARPLAVLSGPTFASEVARGLPTAVTLACTDPVLGARLVRVLGNPRFRPYLADDLIGAQIGGAVKNVLAIACGITIGRRLGENARAALITRGLAEMVRLGLAMGAKVETMIGLSGFGDLTLTCNSTQSRNTSLGIALGQRQALEDVLARRTAVTEGVATAAAVVKLARRHAVEMPITQAVDAVVNHGADIDAMIEDLLARPFTEEMPHLAGLAAMD
jgi:glycerol-3-phosphate dehydrogenase (NAD(P)+)